MSEEVKASQNTSLNTNVETRELEVFDNTSEFAIKINASKARLIYNKYFKTVSGGTVLSFLGVFLSCLTTLFTASFNNIDGIEGSAAVLTAIYVMMAVGFGILSVVYFFRWIYSYTKLNETAFINELKGDTSDSKAKKV